LNKKDIYVYNYVDDIKLDKYCTLSI
jgi:hypothetical protein